MVFPWVKFASKVKTNYIDEKPFIHSIMKANDGGVTPSAPATVVKNSKTIGFTDFSKDYFLRLSYKL
jgi:hypothetical protein